MSSQSSDGGDEFITQLHFFSNEFPNDDVKDLFRRLHVNSKNKRFRSLALFLEGCASVIKDEASMLPTMLKKRMPYFASVLDIASAPDFKQGPLGGALESALLCALEIGLFIGHYEALDQQHCLSNSNIILSGLSIGLFAAAAVSVSATMGELAINGLESVRIAFRLGIHVEGMSQTLESRGPDGSYDSWAFVVTGVPLEKVQDELDRYNTESSNSESTKVFISAADKTSVSVTGPPSRVKAAFRHSQVLRYSKHIPMPVYNGLCHAPHIYNSDNVDSIVHGSNPACNHLARVRLPLLSPRTGKAFPALNSGELFRGITTEILTGGIYLDNLTSTILEDISLGSTECRVFLFRTSIVAKCILSAITERLPTGTIKREDYVDWCFRDVEASPPRTTTQSKLAIVGMSCRLPGGANDTELFWKLLQEGRDVHKEVPADRFDLKAHYDPSGETPNAINTIYGNFIDQPGMFDAAFFNMSPKEAEQTDPMHRLALVTAYEALEMAGYAPDRTPSTTLERIGTFYGQASDDWRELNAAQNIGTHAVPGGERAFANGRINYFFKFGGPSFNIDTACSSGLAAVNAACSALWAGEADTVIAGGLSVITNPDNYAMLGNGHFLSKTGQCKVWDKGADGYCRADGIGSIVIKRLDDAVADNDNILATILSGATNHSAYAASITQPHVGAQKNNYAQVLQGAGINPLDVGYIELHGTGTQVGDAVESESVCDFFAPVVPRRRADQPLVLGAVKSNIGHGEAAAGIASLLKALLVFQKNEIPAHVGIQSEMNPIIAKMELHKRHVTLATQLTQWPRKAGGTRYGMVNSFGAHGGNTTLLLADGPEKIKIGSDPRSTHPIVVSAKSKNSLKANIMALMSYLDEHPDTDLGDLSYTTCARRIHHGLRIGTAASSVSQLRQFLDMSIGPAADARAVPATAPSIAFAFTGQGAFYLGIGVQLFSHYPYYREQIFQLDRHVQSFGFPSVLPIIDGTATGDIPNISTQLSVVVTQIALTRFWLSLGVKPSAVIGHSLGEYAAFVAAGVISAADAIYLVGKRADLVYAACEVGSQLMLSVRASREQIATVATNTKYEVTCMNGHEDTVLGGARQDIHDIKAKLEAHGIKCILLDIPYAFHTAQMDPILESFEQVAKHVPFSTPTIPVLSPLTSRCIFDGKTINAKYLSQATREAVNFVATLDCAYELGIIDEKTIWVDIGPHPVCASFIRNHSRATKVFSSFRRNEDNFATVAGTLSSLHSEGISIHWNDYHKPYERSHSLLKLNAYKWNEKDYWIQYVGSWTIDKGYPGGRPNASLSSGPLVTAASELRTSSVHQIISETIHADGGELVAVSDLLQPDMLASVDGHTMNGYGVATSSIWADMALTVGEYLYKKMKPGAKEVHMNVSDMEVFHAQIAKTNRNSSQKLQLEASIDWEAQTTNVRWYNISDEGVRAEEEFARAVVRYEDPDDWQNEWSRMSWLVNSRIEALTRMAAEGTANKLSRNMIYTLFKNVVDYADKYRGMRSAVMHDLEAYADIILVPERHGTWHTPPHWIDSLFHVGGFVLNGSDASDTADCFYVTPGWGDCRISKAPVPGAKYRSYVRMAPTSETNMFSGDVFVLQDDAIVAKMTDMKFRRVKRVLMNHFFSAPDATSSASNSESKAKHETTVAAGHAATKKPASRKSAVNSTPEASKPSTQAVPAPAKLAIAAAPPVPAAKTEMTTVKAIEVPAAGGLITDALMLIAKETGLGIEELTDEATFVELGVDSLTSLVLAEVFKKELSLEVKSSLFIECSTVAELKAWLDQNT